jgi:hypothetical protein
MASLIMFAACTARNAPPLTPQEAAHWLREACGITFARDPVVLPSTDAGARQDTPAVISATVVLPDEDVQSALASLRNNRSLHMRGQSDTRHGYESFPDARPGKECELDTSLHVLYFRYAK